MAIPDELKQNRNLCQHPIACPKTLLCRPFLPGDFQLKGARIAGMVRQRRTGEIEMIPSIRECFDLMDKYRMLDNIRSHSVVVAKVARLIAQGLREAGIDVSVKTTTAGALLHDIGKTASLKSKQDHSEIGKEICLKNHLDEIAPIVAEHVRLKDYELNGSYSEKEIVFYADKRVKHDQIVSLNERLVYILERYSKNQDELSKAIKANFALCQQIQQKLFSKLTFTPESLSTMALNQDTLIRINRD